MTLIDIFVRSRILVVKRKRRVVVVVVVVVAVIMRNVSVGFLEPRLWASFKA
jgi:hypothetical protein